MNSPTNNDGHVGELLSGYIDGELTQQQQQVVAVHCEQCPRCRDELESVQSVRAQVGGSKLSTLDDDVWRERGTDVGSRALRHAGWFIAIVCGVALGAGTLWVFLLDASIELWAKLSIGGIYLGTGLLFLSVLRQRWLERKTDKYKDVEI